jgi:glycerophosphoryl diester phosphodiesterase
MELEIIGHRGFSAAAPENTVAAIDAALAAGAHAVEWDVRVLACGTPIVFHDDTLDRTTDGSGPVDERSWDEVRGLDAGSWFGSSFAGEPVPTLRDAVHATRAGTGRIYPEIKAYRHVADLERIAEVVIEAGMSARTTWISMDWTALERLRELDGAVRIGYIVEHPERFADALERATGDERALLDPDCRILLREPSLAAAAIERGIELAVWTVNEPRDAGTLAAMGVTRFTTDEVTRLLGWARS